MVHRNSGDSSKAELLESVAEVASKRILESLSFLADILAEHLAAAPDSEFVFPAAGGGFLRYHNWRRRVWLPAVESAGLEGVTPHGLRHTCAAILINSEANPILVQRRLGHANISITLDTYGHLFPNHDDALTDHLDDVFAETKSTQPAASSRHEVVELKA